MSDKPNNIGMSVEKGFLLFILSLTSLVFLSGLSDVLSPCSYEAPHPGAATTFPLPLSESCTSRW